MTFHNQALKIKLAISKPLPGTAAQYLMAPKVRKSSEELLKENTDYRNSSVLLLLFPDKEGTMSTIFIERPLNNSVHSGQIALPGGKVDDTDVNFRYTALREAEEEIGVPKNNVEIIGMLTPLYVPASNFLIHPHIGITYDTPEFNPNPAEVKSLLPLTIDKLISLMPETATFNTSYGQLSAPGFKIGKHHMWGATSMIVSEFREMIRSI
jgi:8-oxo-dGTP pyrophosphatase MutT (NUDIX family)